MFGNVEELYNFISSSKKRIAFYENTQKENRPAKRVRRLKRVNTTRWNHRHFGKYQSYRTI